MLDCTACIRRCVWTICADTFNPRDLVQLLRPGINPARPPLGRRPGPPLCRRSYATATVRDPQVEIVPPGAIPSTSALPISYHGVPSRPPEPQRAGDEEEDHHRRAPDVYKAADLERELYWVRDPLKLADKVLNLLKRDSREDYNKALALVRQASKSMPCTVSWNHLVDYNMSKGRVKGAVGVYNEMKKRAQTPDAYTFTTLFRGFSWNAKYGLTLERALSIYHSMFADHSPVKPSVTHTNAVLKVCALTGDIDAMYGVAAKLPTHGKGAPDKLTFTIILNAIRNQAIQDSKGEKASESLQERQRRAVLQGRRMWEEIRDRWSHRDLGLDEELVCAMGRLLLIGHTEQDDDDILSLLEQTMGIPRQIPPLGHPSRRGAVRHAQALDKLDGSGGDLARALLDAREPAPSAAARDPARSTRRPANGEEDEDPTAANPFAPLARLLPEEYRVRPGVNTLSLAIEACTALRLPRPAQDYWGLLTSPDHYNITPDRQNYHVYLRLLRLQRASKLAMELVQDMKKG
ncbi:MAG: hypothetical protein Q9163_006433, partial [Psora crenata]